MVWTGIRRDAGSVLAEQKAKTDDRRALLQEMREHARQLQGLLRNGCDPLTFGRVLDETWQLKRQVASTITNDRIDAWYDRAKAAGAVGGKICGAGGGGFFLLIAPPDRRTAVRQALQELSEVTVRYEAQGSRVLLPFME
jgi:D-glycero-alpha-D-manno-heptose-7-phosphate kinase